MKLYVPLDVDFQVDPKIIAAGPLAECLFVRSLALAKRTMKDGVIDSHHLPHLALGLPGRPGKHAQTLVDVGLWRIVDDGWQIVAWLKRNSSAEAVNIKQEAKRIAAVKANHARWHVGPGKEPVPDCPLCCPNRIVVGQRSESTKSESESEVEPKEEEESKEKSSSSVLKLEPVTARCPTDDDDRFREAIDLVVEAKAMRHPPDDPIPWRHRVTGNTRLEHGTTIRRALETGLTPTEAAATVVGEFYARQAWDQVHA